MNTIAATQFMDMNLDDRVELVPGHVYRKTIGTDMMGITMFWMKRPEDGNSGDLIPKHRHGEEMFYMVKGHGVIYVDDVPHEMKEGDSLLIPKGAMHHGDIHSDEMIILCVETPPRPNLRFFFNDVNQEGAPLIDAPE